MKWSINNKNQINMKAIYFLTAITMFVFASCSSEYESARGNYDDVYYTRAERSQPTKN